MKQEANQNARACQAISTVVLEVVRTLLHDLAVDGKVDIDAVDRLLTLVHRGPVALDAAYGAQEDRCRKIHSRPRGNVGARSNPFQRLMVRPLEPLLGQALPRDLLPNYFTFLDQALGPHRATLDSDCRSVIQALLVVHGANLTWDHFYADIRALNILERALAHVRAAADSPAGRELWHRHLGPTAAHPRVQADTILETLVRTHRGLAA